MAERLRRLCGPCHAECAYCWPYCHHRLVAEMERQERDHNLQADLAHEEELARAHAYGDGECPWPWYADEPTVEVEPEVFGP